MIFFGHSAMDLHCIKLIVIFFGFRIILGFGIIGFGFRIDRFWLQNHPWFQNHSASVAPAGVDAPDALGQCILEYAQELGNDAVWMDWVDAVLFAENMEKTLGFVNYNVARPKGQPLEIQHANFSLQQIPGLEADGPAVVERTPTSWCLLSCNASFDPRGQANHWMPCVFKECVPEKLYAELVKQQVAKLKVTIAELQSQLMDQELDDDINMAETICASLNEEISSYLVYG